LPPQDPKAGSPESPAETAPASSYVVRDRRFWAAPEDVATTPSEDAAAPRYPSYVEQLRAEAEAARREAAAREAELRALAASVQEQVADGLAAAEGRIARDAERRLKRAQSELATGMIEVLDNLQRSLAAAEATPNLPALLEGLRLVEAQFIARLAAYGVEPIATVGEPFDPTCHEAVALVPTGDPAAAGRVAQEVQSGFRSAEGVVRPARVVVAKLAD